MSLNNSGTARPIWLNFFLLAPSWSRDGFRPKKSGSGIRFYENPEKSILAGNCKVFLHKSSNFYVKNRRLYKFSNILSSEMEGQSPPIADLIWEKTSKILK